MEDQIAKLFAESARAVSAAGSHLPGRIARAVEMIVACCKSGGSVLLFGNGGSAADAQHIACELVGRFMLDRPPIRAQALSTDTSSLTAISNDYGYDGVFARQVEACGRAGDVAVGLSTSGNSANVVAALAKAREIGMSTIAFTGDGGGECAGLADVLLDPTHPQWEFSDEQKGKYWENSNDSKLSTVTNPLSADAAV